MKKYTIVFLLLVILCASLLGACREKTEVPVLETRAETVPAETIATAPAESAVSAEPRHITGTINECHTIDADVYGPVSSQTAQHRVKLLDLTPEKAMEVLCPGDTIVSQKKTEHSPLIAITAGGKKLSLISGHLYFSPANDGDRAWEQMRAYAPFYLSAHPEREGAELSFMSAEDAKALATKALKDLGVALEPEFLSCAGLTAAELAQYQAELREEHNPIATLGTSTNLDVLTEEDDGYFMKIRFRYDNLPVLSYQGEPKVGMHGWDFPSCASCEMLIGKDGIRILESWGLLAEPEALDSAPVISAEEAVEIFKNMPGENFSLEFQSIVTKVFLEYVPIPEGKDLILRPYWCVSRLDKDLMEASDLSSVDLEGYSEGTRINAYTGGDLADWE